MNDRQHDEDGRPLPPWSTMAGTRPGCFGLRYLSFPTKDHDFPGLEGQCVLCGAAHACYRVSRHIVMRVEEKRIEFGARDGIIDTARDRAIIHGMRAGGAPNDSIATVLGVAVDYIEEFDKTVEQINQQRMERLSWQSVEAKRKDEAW